MRSGSHGLRVSAFNSVFKLHRAHLYGDKDFVLVIMLFTSQQPVLSLIVGLRNPVYSRRYALRTCVRLLIFYLCPYGLNL